MATSDRSWLALTTSRDITLEFTSAGFAPDAPVKDNFDAEPRLLKSHD
jgi:hypothetical protein